MSRGLIVLCLFAVFATPIVATAGLAETLSASLGELAEDGVVDPVDPESPGETDVVSIDVANPLAAVVFAYDAVVLDRFRIDRPILHAAIEPDETQARPYPNRERRQSRLQVFLI